MYISGVACSDCYKFWYAQSRGIELHFAQKIIKIRSLSSEIQLFKVGQISENSEISGISRQVFHENQRKSVHENHEKHGKIIKNDCSMSKIHQKVREKSTFKRFYYCNGNSWNINTELFRYFIIFASYFIIF